MKAKIHAIGDIMTNNCEKCQRWIDLIQEQNKLLNEKDREITKLRTQVLAQRNLSM